MSSLTSMATVSTKDPTLLHPSTTIDGNNVPAQVRHKAQTWAKLASSIAILLQVAASVLLVLWIIFSTRLSSHVREAYQVYHDVGGAAARMLMPAKLHTYATPCNMATTADAVPLCGAALNGIQTRDPPLPYQLPLWALPDDTSGLTDLVNTLVSEVLVA
jgi:hypothetical protein